MCTKKCCPWCNASHVQCHGITHNKKQRFKCTVCNKTFIWSNKKNKKHNEKHWFKLWVYDGYTMDDLSKISGYSVFKIKNIIYYWLHKEPNNMTKIAHAKYVIYDATYFHKEGCLMILFDALNQTVLKTLYCYKEGYYQIVEWLNNLMNKGFHPIYVTMDGEQGIMKAFKDTWRNIKIQRCIFHIQHEGCRWLRTYPKTEAGKNLKRLLLSLPNIKSVKDQKHFIHCFKSWLKIYQDYVLTLPMNIKANYDLKRTSTLIKRALPDMFYYINEPNVRSTSNILESLHGRIKKAYNQHCGLTHKHKIQFLKWYCYYENQHKTNIF